jgi:sorting nexin-1/2
MIDYITVSDPVIHADGMNKYTSYRVDCRPSSSSSSEVHQDEDVFLQYNNNNYSSVLRRYTDFKWLYDTSQCEKSGAIQSHHCLTNRRLIVLHPNSSKRTTELD